MTQNPPIGQDYLSLNERDKREQRDGEKDRRQIWGEKGDRAGERGERDSERERDRDRYIYRERREREREERK